MMAQPIDFGSHFHHYEGLPFKNVGCALCRQLEFNLAPDARRRESRPMFICAAKKSLTRLVLLLVMLFAGMLPASATNYFTRTWQVEQGLPQNKVTAVV